MRSRLVGMVAILAALTAVEFVAPTWFPVGVALLLLCAPAVNWWAFWRIRNISRRAPEVRSAETAYYSALFLATASTVIAIVVFAGRILPTQVPKDPLLIGFAFGLLLMTGPAFDWLVTFSDD